MRIPFFTNRRNRRQECDTLLTTLALSNAQLHDDLFELVQVTRRREAQVIRVNDAANNLEAVWNVCHAWEDAPRHFTCQEAEALAELLREVGLTDLAEKFIEGHAMADNEDDDMHHEKYVELVTQLPTSLAVSV
ncbi:hypothetical protein ABT115_08850 [Streptomyces sp. NPDC001832]|uniref:hypothetical protein n=1 Tax=Streptomyces sp. NPDC001832 TaxID=3154527 RepID=UPI0033225EF5